MEYALLIAEKILIMAAMIALGYILKKKNYFEEGFIKTSSRILAQLVAPVIIVNAFLTGYSEEKSKWLIVSMILSLIVIVVSIIITYILLPNKKYNVERFGAIGSNCGFIGVPLVSAAFGSEAVFCTATSVALYNIFYWTVGLYQMTGDRKSLSFKKIIANPCIIAFIVGVVIFYSRITAPSIITNGFSTFTGMVLPLSSIVVGNNLASVDLKQTLKHTSVLLAMLIRLIIVPVAAVFIFSLVDQQYYLLKYAVLVVVASPSGANTTLFATLYNQDTVRSTELVCLTSILCIITIPLVVALSAIIW